MKQNCSNALKLSLILIKITITIIVLKIKVREKEYLCKDSCVYGCISGKSELYVYAELGIETKYDPPEGVKPEEGRMFLSCTCYFALNKNDLNQGLFEEQTYTGRVLVYQ